LPDYANPVAATIHNGNLQLVLALAIVAGYRWPAAWAIVIHTKVTPGIGLLWYVARGEWRRLAIAIGATLALAAASFVIAPDLWWRWIGLLREATVADALQKEPVLGLPLLVRLPLAAILIVWGARTDRYWTVPIGAMLALPAIQLGGFAVAVGAIPMLLARGRRGSRRSCRRRFDACGAGTRTGWSARRRRRSTALRRSARLARSQMPSSRWPIDGPGRRGLNGCARGRPRAVPIR
jgi:hypothetical protein